MSLDDIFDDEGVKPSKPETEKPQAESEPAAQAPEPEPVDDVGGDEAPEADRKSSGDTVPLAAFLELQNKLKGRLEEAEARAKELEAAQAKQVDVSQFLKQGPKALPSIYDDENAYNEAVQQRIDADLANRTFQMSLANATRYHGEEKAHSALKYFGEAAKQNPILMQAAQSSIDPVGEIINWYEDQTGMQAVKTAGGFEKIKPVIEAGGLEAYEKALRAKWEAEMGQQAQAPTPEPSAAKPKPQLPGSFSKGGKGSSAQAPARPDLGEILGS